MEASTRRSSIQHAYWEVAGVARSVIPHRCGASLATVGWLAALVLVPGCQKPREQYRATADWRHYYVPPEPLPVPARPAAIRGYEQTTRLGQSVDGRPIEMTVFGREGETTLILGAFHGNEPSGADVARSLIEHLRAHPELTRDRRVAVVPVVNPDGLLAATRHNRRNVDLNRNLPARNFPSKPGAKFAGGPFAGSEPETQAVVTAIREIRPVKIISIHSIARGRHGNNYDGPAHDLAVEMSRHNRYPVLTTMGYPTPGSFGSWAGVDQQIPTITLELPRDASGRTCWQENREALLAAIRFDVNADRSTPQRTTSGK